MKMKRLQTSISTSLNCLTFAFSSHSVESFFFCLDNPPSVMPLMTRQKLMLMQQQRIFSISNCRRNRSTSTTRIQITRHYHRYNILQLVSQNSSSRCYHHGQISRLHRFYSTTRENQENVEGGDDKNVLYSQYLDSASDNNNDEDDDAHGNSNGKSFGTAYHTPVMWKECLEAMLDCERGRIRKEQRSLHQDDGEENNNLIFVDGTLGGGGHSASLLQGLEAGDIVVGCDIDPNAIQESSARLSNYMDHSGEDRPLFIPVNTNFGNLAKVLPTVMYPGTQTPVLGPSSNKGDGDGGGGCVDGILLDLGVSSHQIDEPKRGFSFMRDGPLDMRMSAGGESRTTGGTVSGLTAADICNEFDEQELQRIFSKYGDEPRAKTIAQAVVRHRPLSTSRELVEAIASVTPAYAKNKRKGMTATCARIFQSLRIVVNNEDGVLEEVLSDACPKLLRPGGRLVVLSYHSMEDRATKQIMRDGSFLKGNRGQRNDERDIYGNYVGPPKPFKPVGKMRKACEEETLRNPRARSAILRVAERQDV